MSQVFDDLYNQVQDLQQASDNIQPTIDQLSNIIQPDGTLRGQLDFPLDDQSVQEIKELFPTGTVTLSAGAATVTDSRVGPSSTVLVTVITPGGTRGFLSVSLSSGSFTVNSTSATETSTINYLIIP